MAKFIRFVGFLILALALYYAASGQFAAGAADDECRFVCDDSLTEFQMESTGFALPRWPCLPDAELVGSNGQVQSVAFSRVQRAYAIEYIFSLRDWMDKLAQYKATLIRHRSKLYDVGAYYPFHSVCDYFVFTLRRILI